MNIISYIGGIVVDGAHLHFRNPRWYDVPERGFDYVIAKEEHILDDYRQMGVQPYAEIQEEEGQREEKEVELGWNEMRKLAKELSGEVIKSKEQAQKILSDHGY